MEILGEASLEPQIAITVARAALSSHRHSPAAAGPSNGTASTAAPRTPRTPVHALHADSAIHRGVRAGQMGSPATGSNLIGQSQRERVPKEIRVPKTPSGLDISIMRGQPDAQGRTTVEVQWINPTGNLGNDGRVKEGDTLLSINGHSLLGIPLENAAQLLSLAKGNAGVSDQDDERTVELRDDQGGFGLVLGSASSGGPIRIKEVIAGSSAAAAGLKPGQEVVALNGRPLEGMTVQRATMMLSVAKVRSGGENTTTITVRNSADVVLQYMSNRHAPLSSPAPRSPLAHPSGLERTSSGRLRRQPLSPAGTRGGMDNPVYDHDRHVGGGSGRLRRNKSPSQDTMSSMPSAYGGAGESLRSDSPDESHDGGSLLDGSFVYDDLDATAQHVGGHSKHTHIPMRTSTFVHLVLVEWVVCRCV